MNENVDLKTTEGASVADAAALAAVLKEATGLKATADKNQEFLADLVTQVKGLADVVAGIQSNATEQKEAAEVNELQKESLSKAYQTETDPIKKAAMKAELGRHYSDNALQVLDGTQMKNLLMLPLSSDDPARDRKREFRKFHDLVSVATAMKGGIVNGVRIGNEKPEVNRHVVDAIITSLSKSGEFDLDLVETYRKAQADSWDTVADVEWIPVNLSRDYVESIWLPLRIAPLFRSVVMTSPSFKLPYVGGRARAALMGQTTTLADFNTQQALTSQRTSSDITFTAKKLGVQQGYSDEIEQDAIVPTTMIIMESIRDAMGASIEDAALNGSLTANNLDNAVGGSEKWVLGTQASALGRDAWNGIRIGTQTACKVDTDGVLTAEMFRTGRKKMGRYAAETEKLVWIMSINSINDVMNLPEVITVDKYGPGATILRGEIGQIDGIRIIVSEFVYTDLATTGLYTGAGNTRTAMYLVYLPAYAFGDRKAMRIEQDRQIVSQSNVVVGSMRLDFQDLQGSETTEAWLYDLAA